MAFPKGKPRPANAGRKAGTPNHNTTAVKDMLRGALDDLGGKEFLVKAAVLNPTSFLSLVGRLIPNEVIGNLTIEHKLEIVDLSDKGDK